MDDHAPGTRLTIRGRIAAAVAIALIALGCLAWSGARRDSDLGLPLAEVARRSIVTSVTEYGVLEPLESADVVCELPGGGTILWVIEEGKSVHRGDEVLILDSSEIDLLLSQQTYTVELARALAITAAQANEVTRIAEREYERGTSVNELRAAEVAIALAEENLRAATIAFEHAQRVADKGYVSTSELDDSRLTFEQCQHALRAAETARSVLVDYTQPKTRRQLASAAEAARAVLTAERRSLALENEKLARYRARKDKCVLRAPRDGVVVYVDSFANRSQFWSGSAIAEGNRAAKNQTMLAIPDLSRMLARVFVHERRMGQIAEGMDATVRVGERQFAAFVKRVAKAPEPPDDASSAERLFVVDVEIASRVEGLRPRAPVVVEIFTGQRTNVLAAPVDAVAYELGKPLCWVRVGDGFERREIELGRADHQWVEVTRGLSAGERVLATPRTCLLALARGEETSLARPLRAGPTTAAKVRRGDVRVTFEHDGWTNGLLTNDISCRARNGVISWIVESGSLVRRGQEVCRLETQAIEEAIELQRVVVARAETLLATAEGTHRAAAAAPDEYMHGLYRLEQKAKDMAVELAENELAAASHNLEQTRKMRRLGYATPLAVESLEFAVRRRTLELDAAKTARESLELFSRPKVIEELTGLRDAALAQMRAQIAMLVVERAKLARLEHELVDCVYFAPSDGLVIHANVGSKIMEPGCYISFRRKIITLPETARLRVEMRVHESKLSLLRMGMPAVVHIGSRDLRGRVIDPGFSPCPQSNGEDVVLRDEYQVIVEIDDDTAGLRPIMGAKVEFILHDLRDVLKVPVRAVTQLDERYYCWVKGPLGYQRREVRLGPANDREVQITAGLSTGEVVALEPLRFVADAQLASAE